MRLFVAFDVPEDFSSALSVLQKRIRAKASLPKTFHLTLKFLGDVDENRLSDIIAQLEKVRFSGFRARFSGLGAFPDAAHARVVWLGLEPTDIMADIAKRIDSATKGFGDSSDNKPFVPHITLARIKLIEDKKEFADSLKTIAPPKAEFPIAEFRLMKSVLTPQGPEYEVLKAFPASQ